MKPGATTSPLPSMTCGLPAVVNVPTATMRSPLMRQVADPPGLAAAVVKGGAADDDVGLDGLVGGGKRKENQGGEGEHGEVSVVLCGPVSFLHEGRQAYQENSLHPADGPLPGIPAMGACARPGTRSSCR